MLYKLKTCIEERARWATGAPHLFLCLKKRGKMKKRTISADAKRYLSKVPERVSFWLCTGAQLRSLKELSKVLQEISDDVFRYHVNRDKNDFENWIRDVIHHKELAREISRIKTKETLSRKIDEGVAELTIILKRSQKPNKTAKKASRAAKKKQAKKS